MVADKQPEHRRHRRERTGLLKRKRLLFRGFLVITAAEFLHAAGDVHQFLLSGEERMTFGADADFVLFSCGLDFPDLSAGAGNGCGTVVRMNTLFHVADLVLCSIDFKRRTSGRI